MGCGKARLNGVAGAKFFVIAPTPPPCARWSGRYSMAGLPAGSLAIVAGKPGAQAQVQRFASVEGGAFTADFVFPD